MLAKLKGCLKGSKEQPGGFKKARECTVKQSESPWWTSVHGLAHGFTRTREKMVCRRGETFRAKALQAFNASQHIAVGR